MMHCIKFSPDLQSLQCNQDKIIFHAGHSQLIESSNLANMFTFLHSHYTERNIWNWGSDHLAHITGIFTPIKLCLRPIQICLLFPTPCGNTVSSSWTWMSHFSSTTFFKLSTQHCSLFLLNLEQKQIVTTSRHHNLSSDKKGLNLL